MPLPGFPYATIVGFGVLVVAAGLYMLFANPQQVPISYGNTNRRRRSVSPPPTGGSWNRSARYPSRNSSQAGFQSGGSEYKSDPSDKPKHAGYSCIICLDCEERSRFVKLRCGHHYHINCLKKWFEASQKGKVCPSCNVSATSQ